MKKKLRFLYRYFTTTRRWRVWINAQTVLAVLISILFLVIVTWTAPLSAEALATGSQEADAAVNKLTANRISAGVKQAAPTPSPAAEDAITTPAARTTLPAEYYRTDEQSIGISIGALVLALIVVGGVFFLLPGKRKE